MIDLFNILNSGLPITEDPYQTIAEALNISKKEVLQNIRALMKEKKIIKLRAELDYERLGYKFSALIAMQISSNQKNVIDEICTIKNVTHLYERKVPEEFPFSYFAMTHFRKESEMNAFLKTLKNFGVKYKVMRTLKKYKRGGKKQ